MLRLRVESIYWALGEATMLGIALVLARIFSISGRLNLTALLSSADDLAMEASPDLLLKELLIF